MERKKKSTAFANRLKASRIKMKLTQAQFCKDYSLFTGRKGILPVSTLSSWEIGAKEPDLKTVERLASFMGVTVDFLIGRTSKEAETRGSKGYLFLDDYIVEIRSEDLPLYSNKPVFFTYRAGERQYAEWGIYNKRLDAFRCVEQVVKNGDNFRYFACTPDSFPQPKRVS